MWNNSHWKVIGDWEKDSWTTKALRNIHMKSSRKKSVRSGPVPWEGTQKKREITWAEILPREWMIPARYWGHQGVQHREDEPHRLVGELVGLIEGLGEAWTPLLRSRAYLLAPEAVRRGGTENCMSGWPVSQDCS